MAIEDETNTELTSEEASRQRTAERLARARVIIEKIENFIAGKLTDGVRKYKIAGASGGARELERYSMGEILALLKYWRQQAADLERILTGTRRPDIRYYL